MPRFTVDSGEGRDTDPLERRNSRRGAAAREHGARVESGDILLVRTGNRRRRPVAGPVPGTDPGVACQVACAPCPWFRERDIAMLGADTSNDARPNRYANIVSPLHTACLVYLGVWLIDNANLADLAAAAARHQRNEFMLSIGALRLRNVPGSPVNPFAIF